MIEGALEWVISDLDLKGFIFHPLIENETVLYTPMLKIIEGRHTINKFQ